MGKFLKKIFKAIWKTITWTRIAILNFIFLLFVVIIVLAIASAPRQTMPTKTALFIAPTGTLVDQLTYNPSAVDLLTGQDQPPETRVFDLVKAINKAAFDSRITSIVLKLNNLSGGGMSKLEELGQALERFKESNKRVYAYSDNFTQQQYFLASYADEVYINDMGTVLLTGFGMYLNYFKDAADKLDLDFHVFRVGNYKDAVEPFMRNNMSEASKEHNKKWINTLWSRYSQKVEQNRKLDSGTIKTYINNWAKPQEARISNAQIALDTGLVDEVMSRTELLAKLQKLFGEGDTPNTFDALPVHHYIKLTSPPIHLPQPNEKNIALIVADGTIYSGKRPEGAIGSESFSATIQKVREDKSVKALVIRVNSGGGSAFASEVIRQEIRKTKEAGIPVYISMGSLAASGGYWMSTGATQIWATPSTLTGSIGVWALYPNINRTFKKFGINTDGFGTSPLASAYRPDVPLSKEAGEAIQRGVNNIYHTFLQLVADARESDTEAVHVIAQGRVWTGTDAKELGLVDNLGTLDDVFHAVAGDINIGRYEIKEFKRPLSPSEEFMRALIDQASTKFNIRIENNSSVYKQLLTKFTNSAAIQSAAQALESNPSNLEVFANCLECIEL